MCIRDSYLDEHPDVLRPANLAPPSPGRGWGVFDGPQGLRLLVMNLIGRCDMHYGPDNPFPVSYTHLDVYKRQYYNRRKELERSWKTTSYYTYFPFLSSFLLSSF